MGAGFWVQGLKVNNYGESEQAVLALNCVAFAVNVRAYITPARLYLWELIDLRIVRQNTNPEP